MQTYKGKTLLICGFPGIGKSFFNKEHGSFVSDSDSSTFAKDGFPKNYIDYIESLLIIFPRNNIFLISTHSEVRDELRNRNLVYIIVYPKKEDKQLYLKRYQNRGSSETFVELLSNNWDSFVESCENDPTPHHYRLSGDQYLGSVFEQILAKSPSTPTHPSHSVQTSHKSQC